MTWLLAITTGWLLLSVAGGLLVGGAVALEEQRGGRAGSGVLREGPLDGEGQPGPLEVGEQDPLVR